MQGQDCVFLLCLLRERFPWRALQLLLDLIVGWKSNWAAKEGKYEKRNTEEGRWKMNCDS